MQSPAGRSVSPGLSRCHRDTVAFLSEAHRSCLSRRERCFIAMQSGSQLPSGLVQNDKGNLFVCASKLRFRKVNYVYCIQKALSAVYYIPMGMADGNQHSLSEGVSVQEAISPPGKKILVVEDDFVLSRMLEAVLSSQGYQVVCAADGELALQAAEDPSLFSLILLDINLPKRNGFEVCLEIRKTSAVPIVIISGRTSVTDKTVALELGADDYITKPFSLDELLSRIKAVLRRSEAMSPGRNHWRVQSGDLVVDMITKRVSLSGRSVMITPTEFDILRALVSNPDEIVSYDDLLDEVWGNDPSHERGDLRVYVSNLRRKLSAHPNEFPYIQTVARVGYRFNKLPPTASPLQNALDAEDGA